MTKQVFILIGFKGIWASGLSISAQLGVRDSNEASWTQVKYYYNAVCVYYYNAVCEYCDKIETKIL